MMLCCTCYMTAMLLVWRRRRRRIGASAANQPMHGFRGSREGSPGWYPAGLIFDPPQRLGLGNICLAMMDWPHTYHAWYVVLLTCSTNAAFVGGRFSKVWDDSANICWRAWLTSVTVQETEYNEMTKLLMAAMPSEERCNWLIHQMTKRGCELWPRTPFCVSRFLSCASKEGCVIWSCQGMALCLILWHVVMPPIARGQTWLYQPSPVSTVPNTGRNLSNSNYGGHDEEEEGMRCGKSVCLGGIHRTVYVMNWNIPQLFSNSKWNPHFISANLTE